MQLQTMKAVLFDVLRMMKINIARKMWGMSDDKEKLKRMMFEVSIWRGSGIAQLAVSILESGNSTALLLHVSPVETSRRRQDYQDAGQGTWT